MHSPDSRIEEFLDLIPRSGNSAASVLYVCARTGSADPAKAARAAATVDWLVTMQRANSARESAELDEADWQAILNVLRCRHGQAWGAFGAAS